VHRPRFVDDAEREHDARGRKDERADTAHEPDAAVGIVGIAEGALGMTDRPLGEHGGEGHQAIHDE